MKHSRKLIRCLQSKRMIQSVAAYCNGFRIQLAGDPAVYAFWWIGSKRELLDAETRIVLSGPGKKPCTIEYKDWWPRGLTPCLYIGKTTNLRKRFTQHLLLNKPERQHKERATGEKVKPVTTTCQLRHGIEHLFPRERNPLDIIRNKVGFSFVPFTDEEVVARFFFEDLLIGLWCPWFNVDSER